MNVDLAARSEAHDSIRQAFFDPDLEEESVVTLAVALAIVGTMSGDTVATIRMNARWLAEVFSSHPDGDVRKEAPKALRGFASALGGLSRTTRQVGG